VIAEDQVADGTFDWTVPNANTYGAKVKVVATDDANQTDEDESASFFAVVDASPRGYVTAETCEDCHQQNYDDLFMKSGHPYKLNKVDGGPPTFPMGTSPGVPNPPTGFTWNDITYMIGGYGYKARFMNSDGYILTTGVEGTETQYNLPRPDLGTGLPAEWVDYEGAASVPKPYTCGSCHTTGWQTFADNGGVNQDGLEGIIGTWEETGIRCEECHGPGVNTIAAGGGHVVSQSAAEINRDPTAELCGGCHFRDTNHNVLASGGYIKHHEQYDELINGGKNTFNCTQCHDPHVGIRYDQGGIVMQCEDCHTSVTLNHIPGPECEDCHMGRASKSARAVHLYEGDIRTHLFTIDTDSLKTKDDMFFLDPTSGDTHTNPYITLDFACYTCHNDGGTPPNGGTFSAKTRGELAQRAIGIHN
jgi:hypothetical protein